MTAKEKIAHMLKKRENKMLSRQNTNKNSGLTKEDKAIKNEIRNKKKEKKRQEGGEGGNEDQFDELLEKYQNKILKKIKKSPGESEATPF